METIRLNGIYRLEYNERQGFFHFEDNLQKDVRCYGWEWLGIFDEKTIYSFFDFMVKKYLSNRKYGRFPEFEIVELELKLFLKLLNYKRKLVNRI